MGRSVFPGSVLLFAWRNHYEIIVFAYFGRAGWSLPAEHHIFPHSDGVSSERQKTGRVAERYFQLLLVLEFDPNRSYKHK